MINLKCTLRWVETVKLPLLPPVVSYVSFSSAGKAKNSWERWYIFRNQSVVNTVIDCLKNTPVFKSLDFLHDLSSTFQTSSSTGSISSLESCYWSRNPNTIIKSSRTKTLNSSVKKNNLYLVNRAKHKLPDWEFSWYHENQWFHIIVRISWHVEAYQFLCHSIDNRTQHYLELLLSQPRWLLKIHFVCIKRIQYGYNKMDTYHTQSLNIEIPTKSKCKI